MHLDFKRIDSLPRLAWCARLRAGDPQVTVLHGPWVEVRNDGFVEGAWDGPFGDSHPDAAITLAGTAGRARPGGIVFSTSSDLYDRLYLTRTDDELLVSNSLTFLLVEAGDEPDPLYPYYAGDRLIQVIEGIRGRDKTFPTRNGTVSIHVCANLLVDPDLAVWRMEKKPSPAPVDYHEHVRLLEATIGRVFENATDPARLQTFEPLATLSRGYDSTAVAALARRRGCTEAVTFAGSTPEKAAAEDNGKPIAERLEMTVSEHYRRDYAARPGLPEAEFCVQPPGFDVVLASLEERLVGRMLVTGHFGDEIWTCDAAKVRADMRQHTLAGLGASTQTEFRLRVGCVRFSPLFSGARHYVALWRISTSPAMRPWSIGGSYDRPIPRRILEDAGVPRELFGHKKMAGAYEAISEAQQLSETSRKDFLAFREAELPHSSHFRMARRMRALYRHQFRVIRQLEKVGRALGRRRWLRPWVSERYSRPVSETLLLHWGFQRIKDRYQTR